MTDQITEGKQIFENIRAKGNKDLYIRVDMDVPDPGDFPRMLCPSGSGLSAGNLFKTLGIGKGQFNIVGFGLAEYVPGGPGCLDKLKDFIDFGYCF